MTVEVSRAWLKANTSSTCSWPLITWPSRRMHRSAIRRLGEHAARPAWPDPARTNQYPVATARPLEDALAVHLAEGITEQLQSCAIGITEVERPANLLIRYPSGIKLRFDPF